MLFELQRIKTGGTLVMELHNLDIWVNLWIVYLFRKFADVQLFKSKRYGARRGAFYLLAQNVHPETDEAKQAIQEFKHSWWLLSFGGADERGIDVIAPKKGARDKVLQEFGSKFVEMGGPIWEIQRKALESALYADKFSA